MKKNINYTEEQLYDQFMAELEEGANEYDRMMSEGEAPALKASKPRTTILSMVRWAAVAACFIGVVATSTIYFLDNADEPQVAIVDKSAHKVLPIKETDTTSDVKKVSEKDPTPLPVEEKSVKSGTKKKAEVNEESIFAYVLPEVKEKSSFAYVLPDVVLSAPDTGAKEVIPAQYANVKVTKERDFYVVCYNVLPEVDKSDSKALANADVEMEQICDKIYYNDVKPFKPLQQ